MYSQVALAQSKDSVNTRSNNSTQKLLEAIVKDLTKPADSAQIRDELLDLEIGQLIVNQTVTKIGGDFYDLFYSTWQWPKGSENFSLQIEERPFRFSTTQIQIKVNDFLVFENYLQPRADYLQELSSLAIQLTNQYITNYNEIQKELGSEDLTGSGIY